MNHFTFEHPYALLLLLLIICIYKCPVTVKVILFPHTYLFGSVSHWINREKLLYSLLFTLLVTALASPISYDDKSAQNRKGRDLVFVLDTSGSMGESGFAAKNSDASKFDLLKQIIASFIAHRYDDNVGVTVFGSFAFSSIPLTYDMKAVAFLLDFIDVGIAGENTAIGDGLASAEEMLRHGSAKSKVIILVTDGYQNSGRTSIAQAVKEAKKLGIKIYTIGLGDTFDAPLLKKIASDTGAKMFTARSAEALSQVYDELDTLEPSPIHSAHYLNKQLLYYYPLTAAFLLLLYLVRTRRSFV